MKIIFRDEFEMTIFHTQYFLNTGKGNTIISSYFKPNNGLNLKNGIKPQK